MSLINVSELYTVESVQHKNYFYGENFVAERQMYENTTGATVEILNGTIMGRVASTGKIVPLDLTATDGSELPYGIVIIELKNKFEKYTVLDTETELIRMHVFSMDGRQGWFKDKLIYPAGEDKDSIIPTRNITIENYLRSNLNIQILTTNKTTI